MKTVAIILSGGTQVDVHSLHGTACGKFAVHRPVIALRGGVVETRANAKKLKGELSLHERNGVFKVSHVASGRSLPFDFASLAESKMLADEISRLLEMSANVRKHEVTRIQEAFETAMVAISPKKISL